MKETIKIIEETIKLSKKYLSEYDNELANYILRDLEITKRASLLDLSWSMHKSGNISKNDVLFLIEKLEEQIEIEKNETN